LIIKLNTTSKLPYMFTQQCEKIVSEYLNVWVHINQVVQTTSCTVCSVYYSVGLDGVWC
jgi:hypothetical protein